MLPHTHIKLTAWIRAANSSLLRQQKGNTVIFIILHVAVSRRPSQNICRWLLLENLINQLYQLRWEKLGTRSLQYIFLKKRLSFINVLALSCIIMYAIIKLSQGKHFFSDVVFSICFVGVVNCFLVLMFKKWIY